MRRTIVEAVREGKILVSDGAWGTLMYQRGLRPGECPEMWNIERPDDILAIAASYIEAGADMIETNSLGGTSIQLRHYGLDGRAAEINKAAAVLSRQAAGDDHWVIASVGTSGKLLVAEEVTGEELYESYKEQAIALEEGGADALCMETLIDVEEAVIAIRAAKENTKCEVICSFTFEKTIRGDFRTLMGVSPADASAAAIAAGADIIGTNCGNGSERMIEIVREIRTAFPDAPILVQANAGLPKNIGGEDVYPETPAFMAGLVPAMVAAGVNIIGGCCGTTPAHIRAIRQAVDHLA
jgi:5-methyltetrahydrofolate--homocysteine methyltransferase